MSSSEMRIEPLYVVDTNALIWYLINDKKLGRAASEVFAAAERGETRLILSSIVFAELYYANKRNQWFADFDTAYREIRSMPFFRIVSFRARHVIDFDRNAAVTEMHD